MEKNIQQQLVKLAGKAQRIIESEKLYTNPLMNRKKLAFILCTNEKYLADAIRQCEGVTINDFINRYRIEHARQLLREDKQITNLSVAIESGINTRITLFRLFRKYYNMSPSEFRKSVPQQD